MQFNLDKELFRVDFSGMKTKLLFLIAFIIPAFLNAGYSAGRSYYTKKNYDKAREEFLSAVAQNPKDGNSYFFLGEIEKNTGNFKEAEEYYRLSIEGNTDKKFKNFAYWNYNLMVEQRGEPKDIVIAYKTFYKSMNNHESVKKIDALIDKLLWTENQNAQNFYKEGMSLKENGKKNEAIESFKRASSEESSFLAPRYQIGMILLDLNDKTGAARELSIVAEKLPFYYGANRLLGDIYFSQNSFANADKYYSNCIIYGILTSDTEYTLLLKRATCRYNMKKYNESLEDARKASNLNKTETDPLFILSAIYINNSDYDKALSTLKTIDKLSPNSPQVLFQIGTIYYKQDNTEYVTYFDKLFNTASSSVDIPDKFYKAFIINANYHFSKKAYPQFVKIISVLPEKMIDNQLRINSGKAFFETLNYKKSINFLESASLSNENKLLLALAYFKDNQKDKCRKTLYEIKDDSTIKSMALGNKNLKPIMQEIINEDKLKKEPENSSGTVLQ